MRGGNKIKSKLQFTSSLILDEHPLKHANLKVKTKYYTLLEYLVKEIESNQGIDFRLDQYKNALLKENEQYDFKDMSLKRMIRSMICTVNPWKKKYRYLIIYDIALILLDEGSVQKVVDDVKSFLNNHQKKQIDSILATLKDDMLNPKSLNFSFNLVEQYRKNYYFLNKNELRVIVTGNMNSGKSTLINALIGKSLAKTSNGVCTENLNYIFNKPFEDGHVHFEGSKLSLDASISEIKSFDWATIGKTASYFEHLTNHATRLCIIDTPGVNYILDDSHGEMTQEAIRSEEYSKLVYVFNANKLGTDEEIKYLKWIYENVSHNKIIFILNKLDDFNCIDDDIEKSLQGIRNDLMNIGYENPKIYPLSSYFSFLIKLKRKGDVLTEDEEDEYTLYTRKFSRPFYDLSKYYDQVEDNIKDDELLLMSKKSGLYGLENILYGEDV